MSTPPPIPSTRTPDVRLFLTSHLPGTDEDEMTESVLVLMQQVHPAANPCPLPCSADLNHWTTREAPSSHFHDLKSYRIAIKNFLMRVRKSVLPHWTK